MKTKNIFAGVLAALILISSAAFAELEIFDPASFESSGNDRTVGYGFYGTVPSIRYNFTKDLSGQFGASASQTSAAGQTSRNFIVLMQGAGIFKRLGDANLKYGGFLTFDNGNSSSGWTVAGTVGFEKELAVNMTIAIDVIPVSFSSVSAGGSSSTTLGLMSGTVISAHFYF